MVPVRQALTWHAHCLFRRALFLGFVGACAYVEEEAAAAGEDVAAALLDWFGVSVRAAEIPAVLARMRVLARKVGTPGFPSIYQSPVASGEPLVERPSWVGEGVQYMSCANSSLTTDCCSYITVLSLPVVCLGFIPCVLSRSNVMHTREAADALPGVHARCRSRRRARSRTGCSGWRP